jgi:hypothetical protein
MRYEDRFLKISSWMIAVLNLLLIPGIVSRGIEQPVNGFLNRLPGG